MHMHTASPSCCLKDALCTNTCNRSPTVTFAACLPLQVESIGADIKQLEPRAFGFWGPEHIQVFDSRWASPASLQGAATSSFLVVVVYVHALVDTRVQYTSKAGKEHHVSLPLTKSGFWLFARGPVPAEAVDELECPWYVVGTW